MTASAFRYFLVLRLHAPYALTILLVVSGVSLYMVLANPFTGLDDGLGMLMFVQMYLASTGFLERARRGHFDSLLTRSHSRTKALAAHWIVSVLPGAAIWVLLCGTALATGSSMDWKVMIGPRSAALFIVSALAWVVGFALTRGTAGFLWTAALFATVMHRTDLVTSISAATVLFCPFALIRNGPIEAWPVMTAVVVALMALVSVWRYAPNLDLYLLEQS